jgi:hypothetical protein
MHIIRTLCLAAACGLICDSLYAGAGGAVQIDVSAILNTRAVTTLTEGKVVPLKDNVDGAGGVITKAAAAALKSDDPCSMPDDGKFPANADHPEVVLNYSNAADASAPQVRRSGAGTVDVYGFDVPANHYAKLLVFLNCGNAGKTEDVDFALTYKEGPSVKKSITLPDWWWNIDEPSSAKDCAYWNKSRTDKDCVYLASNLAKWGTNNNLMEKDHHNIFGLNLRPDPSRVLVRVTIRKPGPPVMVFWGATGVPAAQ